MDTLPNEILIKILSYFDTKELVLCIAKVCTRWKYVCEVPCLHKRFSIRNIGDVDFLSKFEQNRYIKCVTVNCEIDLINSFLENLSNWCPGVVSLTLSKRNPLSDRHVVRLFECFPNLTHINVFLVAHYVTSTFLNAIKNVHGLVLNNQIDNVTLKVIAKTCTNLTEIHMYGYIEYFPLRHLHMLLLSKFQYLKKMTLRCREVNNRTCDLITECRNLKQLYLYHCWLITDPGLKKLTCLKRLSSFHITGLKLVSQKGFQTFISSLDIECLRDLNVSSTPFDDYSAQMLCLKKCYLKRLEIWRCRKLTYEGISYLTNGLKRLFILDTDMCIPSERIYEMIYKSNIKYVRYARHKDFEILIPKDRQLILFDAYSCIDELFRGNGEGYSANLACYFNTSYNIGIK